MSQESEQQQQQIQDERPIEQWNFLVASTRGDDLDCTVSAAQEFFAKMPSHLIAFRKAQTDDAPRVLIRVAGTAAPSDVNAQPVGDKETINGMLNRLQKAKEFSSKSDNPADIIVAIESGISQLEGAGWQEFSWVGIEHRASGKRVVSRTGSITHDDADVKTAQQAGFQQTPVTRALAERLTGESADVDAHLYLTGGLIPRDSYLIHTLLSAVCQLNKQLYDDNLTYAIKTGAAKADGTPAQHSSKAEAAPDSSKAAPSPKGDKAPAEKKQAATTQAATTPKGKNNNNNNNKGKKGKN